MGLCFKTIVGVQPLCQLDKRTVPSSTGTNTEALFSYMESVLQNTAESILFFFYT